MQPAARFYREEARKWYTSAVMSTENSGPSLSPDVIDEERLLARIPRQIIFAAAVLTVPVGLIFGVRTAFVFLLGGMLSALGFAWLRQSLARLLSRGRKDALRSGILMYLLRLMLICGVFLIIILLGFTYIYT